MNWIATGLKQLYRDLRAQKLRSLLTTLGIVWGTVSISLLLAFGDGFHHQLLKNSAGLGNGIVIAWPSLTSIPFEGLGKGRPIRLDEEDIALLRANATELGDISSEYAETLRLQLGPKTLAVDTAGIHPIFGEMRNMIPHEGGRFINPLDMSAKRRVAFLGDELAVQLFGVGDPVGQMIRLHGSPFTVIGVMQDEDPGLLVPLPRQGHDRHPGHHHASVDRPEVHGQFRFHGSRRHAHRSRRRTRSCESSPASTASTRRTRRR